MGESILATIFSISLLVSGIIVLVMSGIGVKYFSSDILMHNYLVNLKILFGCGIAIGILEVAGILFFLLATPLLFHFIVTIPVFVIFNIVLISFSRPNIEDKYIRYYSDNWHLYDNISYQYAHSCCGFWDFSDRGLNDCPFDFSSGCYHVISEYLQPRFKEVFAGEVFGLCLFAVSFIILILAYKIIDEEDTIFDMALFSDII